MTMNETTGLPTVGDGFRWNITETPILSYLYTGASKETLEWYAEHANKLCVRLESGREVSVTPPASQWSFRRPLPRIETRWHEVAAEYAEATPDAIREAATKALEQYNKSVERESLKGIYPPKRLEDVEK